MNWEYKTIETFVPLQESELCKHGSSGWELLCVITVIKTGTNFFQYIFKKPNPIQKGYFNPGEEK